MQHADSGAFGTVQAPGVATASALAAATASATAAGAAVGGVGPPPSSQVQSDRHIVALLFSTHLLSAWYLCPNGLWSHILDVLFSLSHGR